jgi:hypothetical protein
MKNKKLSYYTRLFRAIRQEWSRNNPDRKTCFLNARIKKNSDDLEKFVCEDCQHLFAKSEVQCDHIDPVGSNNPQTLEDLLLCVTRLHSPHLQLLCKHCHKMKTQFDNMLIKRRKKLEILSEFLNLSVEFLEINLTEVSINMFYGLFKKLESEQDVQKILKLERKLDKLKELYL